MPTRYTDRAAKTDFRDFVIRSRSPSMRLLLGVFLTVLCLCIAVAAMTLSKTTLILLLCVFVGGVAWYAMLEIQRSRDLVLATEFQNALFASALGFNNTFCMIIKREGNIVYMDNAFRRMFPDFVKERHMVIANLLKHGKVGAEEREKLFAAIERGVYDKVVFDICGADRRFIRIAMSIEPILRPPGFILLRAREYVEQRGNKDASADGNPFNPLLSKSNITLFAYIMDKMNMGAYMTNPDGNLVYTNPTLELWLAYREGEINSGNFSLKDIVHHSGGETSPIEPGDYEGQVTLQKRAGGLMSAFINQKIIRGESGKPIGCVALVHNIVERDSDSKRKLW